MQPLGDAVTCTHFPADSGRKAQHEMWTNSKRPPQKPGLHSGGERHIILEGMQSPGRLPQPGESSTCRAWPRSPALQSAAGTQSGLPCSTDPISRCLSTPLRPPCTAGYNAALGNGGSARSCSGLKLEKDPEKGAAAPAAERGRLAASSSCGSNLGRWIRGKQRLSPHRARNISKRRYQATNKFPTTYRYVAYV